MEREAPAGTASPPATSAVGQLSTDEGAELALDYWDCWAAAWLGCWPDGVRPHSQLLRPELHGLPYDQPRRPRPRLSGSPWPPRDHCSPRQPGPALQQECASWRFP